METYETLCRSLGRTFRPKLGDKESQKLKKSLLFLGMGATPEETISAAMAVGLISLALCLLIIALLSLAAGFSLLWLVFFGFPALLYEYLKRYPVIKADSEKRKAIGRMPEVMSYLIMSLRISPNIERSVEFAAHHSASGFKEKLVSILSNVQAGVENAEAGLLKLGDELGEKSEEFKRSMQLVLSSCIERTEEKRQETLNKASHVLLDGLSARAERESRALNTPVMIVFTFGVILPLVFVAVIPFMSLMGIQVGAATMAAIYTIGLPALLYFLIEFIASGRPITMGAPRVPNGAKSRLPFLCGASAGLMLTALLFFGRNNLGAMEYMPLVWGASAGIGVFLVMSTSESKKARNRVKKLESGFGETLHQLSVVLSEGRPLEDAMSQVDSELFKKAAGNVRALNTDLRSAFFEERFGSLREVYSDTIRSVADILVSISNKGSGALSSIAFRMSDHIANLKKSEADIERNLSSVVNSMRIIALFVAPMVGGMISSMSVVLASTMAKSQSANMGLSGAAPQPIDPSLITLIIGVYALESAAILSLFGVKLMGGDDKVMKKHNVGIALIISAAVFTGCAWAAGGLFGGIA